MESRVETGERVLIAEDDPGSRVLVAAMLRDTPFTPVTVEDGAAAWKVLSGPDAPRLVLADWYMPGLSGIELCERVRATAWRVVPYVILLTSSDEVVRGLDSGADDFLRKPVDPQELRARLRVGLHHVDLQEQLARRVDELTHALEHVRTLQGIIPICSYCRSIRDDHQAWHRMETYVSQHTDAQFSHGICPPCLSEHFPDLADDDEAERRETSGAS